MFTFNLIWSYSGQGYKLQLGNRAFFVAGPVAWNSLPHSFRTYIINFQKRALLTFLFH